MSEYRQSIIEREFKLPSKESKNNKSNKLLKNELIKNESVHIDGSKNIDVVHTYSHPKLKR